MSSRFARAGVSGSRYTRFSICVLGLASSAVLAAETTVVIGAGQVFTLDDFNNRSFLGQPFEFGPQTTFVVDDGGTLARISPSAAPDLAGSSIVVNTGGRLESLFSSNVHMVLAGGSIGEFFNRGLSFEMRGGEVTAGSKAFNSRVLIEGGTLSAFVEFQSSDVTVTDVSSTDLLWTSGTLNISGGSFRELNSDGEMTITGGHFEFARHTSGTADISGGSFGSLSSMFSSTMNITGATIDALASTGTNLNFSAGDVRRSITLTDSDARFSGGGFQTATLDSTGGTLTLVGGDFMLDGAPVTTDTLSGGLQPGSVLSGTLADGTVFLYRSRVDIGILPRAAPTAGAITPDTLVFERVALAPVDTSPRILTSGDGPQGLRPGEVLTVAGSAQMRDAFVAGASLNVAGGTVNGLRSAYADISLASGLVQGLTALHASTLNMTGGSLLDSIEMHQSRATIRGGQVGRLHTIDGEPLSIDSAAVDSVVVERARTVSVANSAVNSMQVVEAQRTLIEHATVGELLLGFGGFPFGFAGLGAGPVVATDSVIDRLESNATEFSMEGGGITGSIIDRGDNAFQFRNAVLGDPLVSFPHTLFLIGSSFEMDGGALHFGLSARPDSTVTFRGGQIGDDRLDPSESGSLVFGAGSTLNLYGGQFAPSTFIATSGATVNLFASSASLNGQPLALDVGDTLSFGAMNGALLSVVLADGSDLRFLLGGPGDGLFTPVLFDGASLNLFAVAPIPLPASAPLLAFSLAGVLLCTSRRHRAA